MPSIEQLRLQQQKQKEEQYKRQLGEKGSFGGQVLASAVAMALFPAFSGAFKYASLMAGENVVTRIPGMADRVIKNTNAIEVLLKQKKITGEQANVLKAGFKKTITMPDYDLRKQNLAVFNLAFKEAFGGLDQRRASSIFTSSVANHPDMSLGKVLAQSVLPFNISKIIESEKGFFSGLDMDGFGSPTRLGKLWTSTKNFVAGFGSSYTQLITESAGVPGYLAYMTANSLLGTNDEETNYGNYMFRAAGLMAVFGAVYGYGVPKLGSMAVKKFPFLQELYEHSLTTSDYLEAGIKGLQGFFHRGEVFVPQKGSLTTAGTRAKHQFTESLASQRRMIANRNMWNLEQVSHIKSLALDDAGRTLPSSTQKQIIQESLGELKSRQSSFKAEQEIFGKMTKHYTQTTIQDILTNPNKYQNVIPESYRHNLDELIEFIGISGMDKELAELKSMVVGPGFFETTSGKPVIFKTKGQKISDWATFIERNTQIPVLGFSPISFLKPAAMESYKYRNVADVIGSGKTAIFSTMSGAKSATDIYYLLKQKKLIHSTLPVEESVASQQFFFIGNKTYMKEWGGYDDPIDITPIIGETVYMRRGEVAGALGRMWAMETGTVAKPETEYQGVNPFRYMNRNNFTESVWSRGKRTISNAIGVSKVKRVIKKLNAIRSTGLSTEEINVFSDFLDTVETATKNAQVGVKGPEMVGTPRTSSQAVLTAWKMSLSDYDEATSYREHATQWIHQLQNQLSDVKDSSPEKAALSGLLQRLEKQQTAWSRKTTNTSLQEQMTSNYQRYMQAVQTGSDIFQFYGDSSSLREQEDMMRTFSEMVLSSKGLKGEWIPWKTTNQPSASADESTLQKIGSKLLSKPTQPINNDELLTIFKLSEYTHLSSLDPSLLDSIIDYSPENLRYASEFIEKTWSLSEDVSKRIEQIKMALKAQPVSTGKFLEEIDLLQALRLRIKSESDFSRRLVSTEIRDAVRKSIPIDEKFMNTQIENLGVTYKQLYQRMAIMGRIMSDNPKAVSHITTVFKQKGVSSIDSRIYDSMTAYTEILKMVDAQESPKNIMRGIANRAITLMEPMLKDTSSSFLSSVRNVVQYFDTLQTLNKKHVSFSTTTNQAYLNYFADLGFMNRVLHGTMAKGEVNKPASLFRMLFPTHEKGGVSFTGAMAHWFADRPIQLLEELGLGRPDPAKTANAFQSLSAVAFKKVLPIAALVFGFTTLDAVMKAANPEEDSPKQRIAKGVNAVLGALAGTGVGKVMSTMRETFPGLIPAIAVGTSFLFSGGDSRQMLVAGALGALAEQIPTHAQAKRELSGEKNVPIRSGRFWEMGRQPFIGGKVTHFRPSLNYLATTGWEYSQEKYGSPMEYLMYYDPLPTPFNMFGLLSNVLEPYHWEEAHYYNRPYPVTGTIPAANIPMIGPLMEMVGKVTKPTLRMHTEEMLGQFPSSGYGTALGVAKTPVFAPLTQETAIYGYEGSLSRLRSNYTGMLSEAQSVAFESISKGHQAFIQTPGFADSVGRSMKFLQDYTGMVGFLGSSFLFGEGQKEELEYKIASPNRATSINQAYYQQYLGSLFGASEFLRRTIPNYYSMYDLEYNPIRNTMPDWLPGSDHYIDFQHGDPYSKIPFGEARLPGEAYEKTHKLMDNYGFMDRGIITLNVAPYSTEAIIAEKSFEKVLKKGGYLTAEERYKMTSAIVEAKQVREKYNFSNYPYSTSYTTQKVKLGSYRGEGIFEIEGSNTPLELQGIQKNADYAMKKLYDTQDVSLEEADRQAYQDYQELEKVLKALEWEEVSVRRPKDEQQAYQFEGTELRLKGFIPETIASAKSLGSHMTDTSTEEGKRAVYDRSPLMPLMQAWEFLSHRWGFLQEKFWNNQSASEYYERYMVYGQERALWQKPVSDFLSPIIWNIANLSVPEGIMHAGIVGSQFGTNIGAKALFGMAGAAFGGVWSAVTPGSAVPAHTQARWDMEEKYDMYREARRQLGSSDESPTIAGMGRMTSIEGIRRRLPQVEKNFFTEFVNLPEAEYQRLYEHMPSYMQAATEYGRQIKQTTLMEGRFSSYKGSYLDKFEDFFAPIQQAYEENPESIYENPYLSPLMDLNSMRVYESYRKFDDSALFSVYDEDVVAASISMLNPRPYNIDKTNAYYSAELYNSLKLMTRYRRMYGAELSLNRSSVRQSQYNSF